MAAEATIQVEKLQDALAELHKDVLQRIYSARQRSVEAHNRRTNVQPVNIYEGDFVLVRQVKPGAHKLAFRWIGPRRIFQARSELVFEVEDLLQGKREVVHSRRLLLYRSDLDGTVISADLVRAASNAERSYQVIHHLISIREANSEFPIQVEWEGLPDEVDFTEEPAKNLAQDVPRLLDTFLNSPGHHFIKERAPTVFSPTIGSTNEANREAM